MSTRGTPTERVRAEIDVLFGSERLLAEVMEEVARLGVRIREGPTKFTIPLSHST